jgi:hypothetical protein
MICGISLLSSNLRPQHRHYKADSDREIESSSRYKKATSFPQSSSSNSSSTATKLHPQDQNQFSNVSTAKSLKSPQINPTPPNIKMQFSLATITTAAMLLGAAQTTFAAPAPDAEPLEGHLQVRAALLVCQVGGLFPGGGNAACSAEVSPSFNPSRQPLSPSMGSGEAEASRCRLSRESKLTSTPPTSVSPKANPTVATAMTMMFASATRLR